jgi:hypothetical protein
MNRNQRIAAYSAVILALLWFKIATPVFSSGRTYNYEIRWPVLLGGWGVLLAIFSPVLFLLRGPKK